MGILKDLIDQLEEEYGSGDIQPLHSINTGNPEPTIPVVVTSDGRVLSCSTDPPHIRVYAWVLQTLRFIPVDAQTSKILKIPSGEMDATRLRKLARDLRMTDQELQAALSQLVREKDLEFRTDRGRRIYFLAPLRY